MRALLRLRRRLPLPLAAWASSSSSSSEPHEIPTVYSFLQPSVFAPRPRPQPPPPPPPPAHDPAPRKTLPVADAAALESDLLAVVAEDRSDDAWIVFKSLAASSSPPSPRAAAALVSHLAGAAAAHQRLGLKRAFAAAVFLLEKSPHAAPVPEPALGALFSALAAAGSAAPALALARAMLRCGRRLPAFSVWGHPLIEVTRDDTGAFAAFLKVFDEACKLVEEKAPAEAAAMRPDLAGGRWPGRGATPGIRPGAPLPLPSLSRGRRPARDGWCAPETAAACAPRWRASGGRVRGPRRRRTRRRYGGVAHAGARGQAAEQARGGGLEQERRPVASGELGTRALQLAVRTSHAGTRGGGRQAASSAVGLPR